MNHEAETIEKISEKSAMNEESSKEPKTEENPSGEPEINEKSSEKRKISEGSCEEPDMIHEQNSEMEKENFSSDDELNEKDLRGVLASGPIEGLKPNGSKLSIEVAEMKDDIATFAEDVKDIEFNDVSNYI